MKNKEAAADTTTPKLRIDNDLTITKVTTNSVKFQYDCSFYLQSHQDCKTRFKTIEARTKCFLKSGKSVDGFRVDAANYFSSWGGHK
jgi:hypothetical protein